MASWVKHLVAALALTASTASAQNYPSPTMQNITVLGTITGGAVSGQGVATYTAAQHNLNTYDGTVQFSVGLQAGAAEFWQAQGGTTGVGANFFATNGTPLSGNVDGNFVAQGNGSLWFGTGSGWGLKLADPAAPGTTYLTATAGTSATNAKLSSTGVTQVDGTTLVLSAGGITQATVENANSLTQTGNYVQIFGAATANAPGIRCRGDANTSCWIRPSGTAGLVVVNDQGALFTVADSSANTIVGTPVFRTGSSTAPVMLYGNGNNLTCGSDPATGNGSPLATNAVLGFCGISAMAGAPTGVPTSTPAGVAYLVYNTTSHNLNIYDPVAASWYHVALTVGAN